MKRILIVFLVCILASDLELHAQSDSIVSASGEIGGRNGWRGELTVDSYTVWEEDETYFIRLNQFSNLQPGYTLDKVKFYWYPFENNFSPEFDVVVWTGGNANWVVQESNVDNLSNAVYYTNDSSNFGIQVYSQHYTADVYDGIQEVVLTTPYTVTGEEGEIWVGIHCCGYTCGGLADEHCDVNTPWGNFLDYYYSTSESHPGWNLHVPLYYSDDTHSQCKSSPFTLSVWVNVGGVDEVINDWAISLQDPVDNEDFPAHLTADDYIVVDESLDSIYVRFSLYNMGYDTATSDVLIDIYMVDNNGENVYYWEQKSMGVNAENPCGVELGFGMMAIAVIGIDQFQEYNLSYPLQVCVSATPADLTVDPDMSNNIACVTYVAEHYFPNSVISPSGEIGVMNNGLEFIGETGIVSQFPRLTDAGELLYYAPIVTTDSASILSGDSLSATAYGTILFNGWNEEIDERGFQISTAFDFSFDVQTYIVDSASLYIDCDSPCTENEFSFTFSELTAGTTYYVRAYATNASGIRYGEARRFTTAGIGYPIDGLPCPGTPILTDIDGNTYNTVQIGAQCWMRENLKTTMYADGTPISHGNEMSTTIAYWYFPNESSYYKATYGLLYNWKAVMRDTTTISCNPSGVQGICPTGWHVPSDAEWRRMEMAAGMSQSDAGNTGSRGNIAAKLCGNTGWNSSTTANAAGNLNAPDRNSTGFSALPASDYYCSCCYNVGSDAAFWSATEYSSDNAYYRSLYYRNAGVYRDGYGDKAYGRSVRCVRDEEEGSSVTLPTSGSYSITTCDEWIYDCGGASADYSNNSDGFITIYPGGSARVVIDQGTYNVENNYDKIYVYDGEGTNEPLLATLTGSDSISTPIGSTVGPLTIRFVSDVIVTNDGFALHVSCTNTPGVNTAVVSNITGTTAICGGNVTADGCANVTARGVCWSTSQNPTVSDSHTTDGSGTGSFTSSITGLAAGTTYYVRAYATNSAGTSYGAQRSFTTILFDSVAVVFVPDGPNCATQCIDLPFVVSSFPSGSAFSRNTDLMSVGLNIEHSYIGDINISLICPDGRSVLLMPDHNSNSFAYYFGRPCEPDGSYCSASDNVPGTGWNYYWSEDSIYAHLNGHCYDANNIGHDASSTIDSSHLAQGYPGAPDFVRGEQYYTPYQSLSDLIGCPLNGLWQIEICDTWGEDNGYVFGWGLTFDTTLLWRETVAIVTTSQATDITYTSASIGGEVVSDGGATVTARGVCWSTSQNPTVSGSHTTDGSGTGSFTSSITGLAAGTTYYVRAYATNSVGTAYGEIRSFTIADPATNDGQPCPGVPTLTDIDGNTYNTVQIGEQCWMKENLRTTKKPNGTSISSGIWTPSSNSVTTYGRLYSWSTVMNGASSSNSNPSGVQGICPTGWHVPSDNEWKQMEMAAGMSQSDADNTDWRGNIAAKLCGNTGWSSSSTANAAGNLNAPDRNSTGFSALPAGYYDSDFSSYYNPGLDAYFWSATETSSPYAYGHGLYYLTAGVYRNDNHTTHGYSVRCVRDEEDSPTATLPTVTTSAVSNITETTATCGGNVTADGGANVTARGICWSTSQNPTVSGSHTTDGSGTGSFTSNIAGLSEGTTYYVRAYATNSAGTAYGEQRSFTTAVDPCNPYLVGRVASTSSAIDGSDLTETIVEHTTSTDTTSQFEFFVRKNCADCDTKISLEVDLYVLDENGNESLMGNVNDYANLSFASYLDYNYTQWTPAETPSISIPGHYVSFSGLSQRLNYFKLCYADPDYSCNPVSMVTPASMAALPYYGPDYAGGGTPNLGRVHGIKVSSWRQAGTYKFVIRLVRRDDATAYALTSRDLCNENQLGGHSAALTSMVYDTLTFWVQVDTALTDGQPCPGVPTLTDADGNTYNTVQIGEQCWMKENLRTTKKPNGTSISSGIWAPGSNSVTTYGRLYNWATVMNGEASSSANPSNVQGICPDGWHVPSDNEWTQLTDYVSSQSSYCCSGNTNNIAKALASTTGWNSYTGSGSGGSGRDCNPGYNSSGNNATGFSALPAGFYFGSYYDFGNCAYFWSATENDSTYAYTRYLYLDNAWVYRDYNATKAFGFSVRCVRD